jgi:aryl-alcohol dehydrogenase-like predicted oxidoreductase
MITRREWLGVAAGAAASAVVLEHPVLRAIARQSSLITHAIPATGERLPVVGLGSSATFSQVARSEDLASLREVFSKMAELGGTVFDTAPGYGASEQVAGQIVNELGIAPKVFWATKVNVAGRGRSADPAAARAQIEQSFARIKRPVIDLMQVHNLGDVPTQLPILKELKAQKRVRYIGVTTTFEPQYAELVQIMRNEPLDFIGVNYAVDDREVETTILPLAIERRMAVLAYAPFGRTRLWSRVSGRQVPDWAKEFDATTWAQFFLKFVVSHPAVTAATPATSDAAHMADNMGGAMGRLPDEATRRRMVELVNALPGA